MNKVLIFGSFDILHPGHLFLIKEAKKYGEVHAVFALDQTIASIKGRMPYRALEDRMKAIRKYGVIPHAGDPVDRLRVTREIDPQVVVIGHDQHVFVEKLEHYQQVQKPSMRIVRITTFHRELFSSSKYRKVLEDTEAGFICIDKQIGEPSLRSVTTLRNMTGIRQIGFSGTLDPLASGLLICGISKAATLLDWFHFFPKTYEAEMTLGSASDSYDAEGAMTKVSSVIPTREALETTMRTFLGKQVQEPPMFSAKKVDGKKLYALARKGEIIERTKHSITIFRMALNAYEYPKVRFMVACSSGTYIRSLVSDIGQSLGVGAFMSALRRTAIGSYSVKDAIILNPAKNMDLRKHLVSSEDLRRRLNEFYWSSET